MKQFFKIVFASMFGALLSAFILFVLCIVLIMGIVSSSSKGDKMTLKANSILHITFDKPIEERTSNNPLKDFSYTNFESTIDLGLNDILKNIKNAKDDANISGIFLDISTIIAGQATIEEIRNALIDFKSSGKYILAYSEVYAQSGYYLASVADKIYLNPAGLMELRGFNAQLTFLKGALDKLGIEAQIIRVGTFKSAVEPFILDKMSDANREQTTAYIGSMYNHFILRIAEARQLNSDSVFAIANQLLVRTPTDAVNYKLVDGLKYKDEILNDLASRSNLKDIKDIPFVSMKSYKHSSSKKISTSKQKVAVIYANGEITGGKGDEQTIGSEGLSKTIRKARLDKDIKAIVLRINSPGGSAIASDVIWREIILARKEKPVIASMSDVAASGGYYIACAADTIIAQANTITGSIGVFGLLPNAKGFFNSKLGVTFDNVKTGEYADLGTITRPLTLAERGIIQLEVNRIYEDFTQKVADGRSMSLEAVKAIAEGRVWSGIDAKRIGLVDELGGIDDAIRLAAEMANISDYRTIALPEMEDPFTRILNDLTTEARTSLVKNELGDAYKYYQQLEQVKTIKGIQTRLPFLIEIY